MVDLRFRVGHYRAKAAEAEENARQAKDPCTWASWLEAAQSWTRLAQDSEELERESKKKR
jgi:hypothetical protein